MAFTSMTTRRRNIIQYIVAIVITCALTCMSSAYCSPCEPLTQYKIKLQDGTIKCVPCSECSRGQCIAFHCFGFTDNICRAPGENEYIHGQDCTVCSDCGDKRTILANCTQHSDTRCGGCIPGFKWDSSLFDCVEAPYTSPRHTEEKVVTANNVITTTTIGVSLRMAANVLTLNKTGLMNGHHIGSNRTLVTDSSVGNYPNDVLAMILAGVVLVLMIMPTVGGVLYCRRKKYREFTRAGQTDKLISNEETNDTGQP